MNNLIIEILIVEDNLNDVDLTLDAFRQQKLINGIHVVHDGAEALAYIFRTGTYADRVNVHPKVILLDLKLPKVNGIEVLRRLRATPGTANIPVVVLTSSSEERDIIDTYDLGVNSYIVKPVDFEQFSAAVRQIGLYWLLLNQVPSQQILKGEPE